jgi:hypothetical protein
MAGISGSGIDRFLYPSIYGPEDRAAAAYGRRAGAAAGVGGGGAEARQAFRQQTALERISGQQAQAQNYGQLLGQLAMLAAFMRQRQQPSLAETQTESIGTAQPYQYPGQPIDPAVLQLMMLSSGRRTLY